ncbi:hypothetical protein EG346_02175 [Chryseobacterium carnipullorum]|uniref:DUF3945 domain-containing protein n=1 Tax=Chryseobacterium carnipullorum TaxID=1124835 RepID=A0A376EE92_CHRCU|nr:hypothetical protein [Chryseobacterium carnipullorum]AZA47076.1 hypothetical protein EG346_02175 [Chryseobacterium carnipullorum]AZA66425.1 hypothetical protein EG345_18285 [Chryseobacterium carnipullorum]STD07704.1 Uncharacterised protein [Chryseobacterium carnipullorum]
MNTNTLPTDELKKYGIINEDNSFSKKLNTEDIQKFLQGYTIVADHDKNRATFQLTDNNSKLKVIFLERDKNISEILENSKNNIQYTDTENVSKSASELNFEKKAFIFDKETNQVVEFDFIKNARELTAIIADKKNTEELNRYKTELLKLKSFLQDKIDQFPEMAKEITNDLNIVSKEFNTVAGISEKQNHSQKREKSDIQLNVNDPDVYQDANRIREEESQEQDEEIQKSRGFRR